jgi:hypothetical protein
MDEVKQNKNIFRGTGYLLGLIFGIAIMIAFAIGLGATYFGIMLGLSFSLCIGIALECALSEGKWLAHLQKIMLGFSAILLLLAVLSLILLDEIF